MTDIIKRLEAEAQQAVDQAPRKHGIADAEHLRGFAAGLLQAAEYLKSMPAPSIGRDVDRLICEDHDGIKVWTAVMNRVSCTYYTSDRNLVPHMRGIVQDGVVGVELTDDEGEVLASSFRVTRILGA